jgi:hypothetical protein
MAGRKERGTTSDSGDALPYETRANMQPCSIAVKSPSASLSVQSPTQDPGDQQRK